MHPNVRNPDGCNGILVRSVGRGCSSKREDITFFLHTKIEIARKIGNVKEALSELGMTDEIDHVTDFGQIAAMGVMSTPALVIDNKVVSMGKVLSKDDVIKALRKVRG